MTQSERRETKVQIISITFDTKIKGQAKEYPGTEVIYKTLEGKVQTKNIHSKALSFVPSLRGELEAVSPGEWVVVTDTKDGDFWKWLTVVKVSAPTLEDTQQAEDIKQTKARVATAQYSGESNTKQPPTQTQVRSNYETPEERAARQILIVRQSSLSSAIALLALDPSEYIPGASDVIAIAEEFEAYVFGEQQNKGETDADADNVNLPE